jgi:C-terminal processing protease CtpA/Prc
VVAGSAAAKAGVQVGDELVRIDDRSTAPMLPYQARELFRAAGQTRRLSLKRGGKSVDVQLALTPIV